MNIEGEERGRLDGVPEAGQNATPSASPPPAGQPQASSFEFNNPTIISLLYLAGWITGGVTAIVGIVLVYVWERETTQEWEASHYRYLKNTFWIGLVGSVVSVALMLVLIGFLLLPAICVLFIVRCVLSLINAQKRAPMPNPGTLLA